MRGAKKYSNEFLSKMLNSEFTLPAYALDIFLSLRWNILALVVTPRFWKLFPWLF